MKPKEITVAAIRLKNSFLNDQTKQSSMKTTTMKMKKKSITMMTMKMALKHH
jgi:hypothetical protein